MQIFRNTDLEVVTHVITRVAVHRALYYPIVATTTTTTTGGGGGGGNKNSIISSSSGSDQSARSWITEILINILYKYRIYCSSQSPKSQLILPDALKLLPLYCMSLMKTPALMPNGSGSGSGIGGGGRSGGGGTTATTRLTIRSWERSVELQRLASLTTRGLIHTLYPRLYSCSQLLDNIQKLDLNYYDDNDVSISSGVERLLNSSGSSGSGSSGSGSGSNLVDLVNIYTNTTTAMTTLFLESQKQSGIVHHEYCHLPPPLPCTSEILGKYNTTALHYTTILSLVLT